ncbi:MAG: tetratricopeptide repeat protein [Xanthomonadales bacterium]|nr:tetratricopeptide repeat protein [Xanthomonadales bacterium]
MAAQQHPPDRPFRLNDLLVDPAASLLTGPGGKVHLEPRVMAVLQILALHPGRVVSRHELLTAIWPGGEVYDEALTQCVYQLRQNLGQALGGDTGSLVRTVPKRGYILEARFTPVEGGGAATTRNRFPKRPVLITLALLALLAIAATILYRGPASRAGIDLNEVQTIAVLPFTQLSAGQQDPALELGMADTLIARLSGLQQVIVRPLAQVRGYANPGRDPVLAGSALGADIVVEGSIQRSGDALRVTVRLLKVSDGSALWAGTFNQQLSNIFLVQDEICTRIADVLALELKPRDRARFARRDTSQTEAYLAYVQGRLHLVRLTPPEMQASIAFFREAISLDPNYAQAWLGLANVLFRLPISGAVPPGDYYPEAKVAALRALEIDDSLAEGHAILGWIAFWFEWDWAVSEQHFRRAIQINPNDMESHLGYAHLLSNTGRHDAALAEVRRARELNPYFPIAAVLEAGFLNQAGRSREGLMRLEELRRADGDFWLTRVSLASKYSQLDRPQEALQEAERAVALSGRSSYALVSLIPPLVQLGRDEEARAVLGELLDRAESGFISAYDLALAYTALGNVESALDSLDAGFHRRDPKMTFILVEPRWSEIRDEPRFAELLRRMNLGAMQQ